MTKFFPIEDHSSILFRANGTALTASMVALADIIPNQKFEFPALPIWLYLLGVILAFFVREIVTLFNTDLVNRQKRQDAFDFYQKIEDDPELAIQFSDQLEVGRQQFIEMEKTMLTPSKAARYLKVMANLYYASCICFVAATVQIVLLIH